MTETTSDAETTVRAPGLHIDIALHRRLQRYKVESGMPLVVQVNRAIKAWLDARQPAAD
jgi:hypothetical protein